MPPPPPPTSLPPGPGAGLGTARRRGSRGAPAAARAAPGGSFGGSPAGGRPRNPPERRPCPPAPALAARAAQPSVSPSLRGRRPGGNVAPGAAARTWTRALQLPEPWGGRARPRLICMGSPVSGGGAGVAMACAAFWSEDAPTCTSAAFHAVADVLAHPECYSGQNFQGPDKRDYLKYWEASSNKESSLLKPETPYLRTLLWGPAQSFQPVKAAPTHGPNHGDSQ